MRHARPPMRGRATCDRHVRPPSVNRHACVCAARPREPQVGKRIDAGMLACNDFATCYMCQSLPMGGLKDSGFGKFAGIEGLRGLCVAKAVVEDIVPFVRTTLPPPLRYPLSNLSLIHI